MQELVSAANSFLFPPFALSLSVSTLSFANRPALRMSNATEFFRPPRLTPLIPFQITTIFLQKNTSHVPRTSCEEGQGN